MTWVNTGGAISGGGVTNSPYASEAEVQALKTDGLAGGSVLVTASGSTTARAMADWLADEKRPEGEGAVGDGIADDTLKLQSLITKAGTNGVIRFKPGSTYLVSSGLVPLPGQTWIGYGATLKRAPSERASHAPRGCSVRCTSRS